MDSKNEVELPLFMASENESEKKQQNPKIAPYLKKKENKEKEKEDEEKNFVFQQYETSKKSMVIDISTPIPDLDLT